MWTPRSDYCEYICGLLEESVAWTPSRSADHHAALSKALEEASRLEDAPQYFAVIFCDQMAGRAVSEGARAVAGLLLKNKMKRIAMDELRGLIALMQDALLDMLVDPTTLSLLTRTVGSLLAAMIVAGGPAIWPTLPANLSRLALQSLDRREMVSAAAILTALLRICEDAGAAFAAFNEPPQHDPLSTFLPPLLTRLIEGPDSPLQHRLLQIVALFIPTRAPLLTRHCDALLARLDPRTSGADNNVEWLVTSCQVLSLIMDSWDDADDCGLEDRQVAYIYDIVLVMLQDGAFSLHDESRQRVKREACEFWLAETQRKQTAHRLTSPRVIEARIIDRLVPVLVAACVYDDEEDEEELCRAMEDLTVPDDSDDMKPRHHTRPPVSANASDGESEDGQLASDAEDGQIASDSEKGQIPSDSTADNWSLRKSAAATLDGLSQCCDPALLLAHLLPSFAQRAESADWRICEGALLALGAVAEGVWLPLAPHLPVLLPAIIAWGRSHPHPLLRAMALWTCGRFVRWIVFRGPAEWDATWLLAVASLGDANKRVQQAATTVLVRLLEEDAVAAVAADESLVTTRHVEPLVAAIFLALQCYQQRSRLGLYDLLHVLLQSAAPAASDLLLEGGSPATGDYLRAILRGLIGAIGPAAIGDSSIFPLTETLIAAMQLRSDAAVVLLAPIDRELLLTRALELATHNLAALEEARLQGLNAHESLVADDGLDDFLIVALDLIAATVAGGSEIPSSLPAPLARVLTASLLFSASTNVRQSAFALAGDLARGRHWSVLNGGMLAVLIAACRDHIRPNTRPTAMVVSPEAATNAMWALGETALLLRDPNPHVASLVAHLVPLAAALIPLVAHEDGTRVYRENVAVAAGRLFLLLGDNEAAMRHLTRVVRTETTWSAFVARWTALACTVNDGEERASALAGLLLLLATRSPDGCELSSDDWTRLLQAISDRIVDFAEPVASDVQFALRALSRTWQSSMDVAIRETLTGQSHALHPQLTHLLFDRRHL